MRFNPFNGRMPFFGGRPSFSGMDLSDVAEDVPFEEVKSEPAKAQPQIDKVARGAQVSAEAMSRFEPLMKQDPMSALLVSVIFSTGAKWADKVIVSATATGTGEDMPGVVDSIETVLGWPIVSVVYLYPSAIGTRGITLSNLGLITKSTVNSTSDND